MYLLTACAGSWLILCGSMAFSVVALPNPRSTADLVLIMIIAIVTLACSRIGLISILTLLLRLLPDGRMRAALVEAVLRTAPLLLRSSVLAAVSATLAVHVAHAVPTPGSAAPSLSEPAQGRSAAAPIDPSWPTISDSREAPPDPGWPTSRPGSAGDIDDRPTDALSPPSGESPPAEDERPSGDDLAVADPPTAPETTHVVEAGESLWSIAAAHAESPAGIDAVVNEIYTDNRNAIGPDPNLIMPGQRLEIAP